MYIVDDPLLALLVRFVGADAKGDALDEAFLRRQVAAIQAHLEQFPEEQRSARARQWVEEHSREYRQQWQLAVASEQLGSARCADCPLVRGDDTQPCAIHEQWLELLRRYASGEISSPEYVQRTLDLLARHKARLRVARRPGA